jgi:hypothetical protein
MFSRSRLIICAIALLYAAPAARAGSDADCASTVIVSVKEQKLMLVQNGKKVATYPVSTSKFGLGDRWGSMATPLGYLRVVEKIGDHAVQGAVFHNRRYTGEVLPPNAPGRDAIVTRIIQLRGLEASNSNAYARGIYIHGTPEEKTIGRPVSYGCIRMKSTDVTALYNQIPIGATVQIVQDKFPALTPQPPQPSSGIFASSNGKSGSMPSAQAVMAAKPASSTPPTRKSASLLLATASRGGA